MSPELGRSVLSRDWTSNIAILLGSLFVSSFAKSGNETLLGVLVTNEEVAPMNNNILQRSPTAPREGADQNLCVTRQSPGSRVLLSKGGGVDIATANPWDLL